MKWHVSGTGPAMFGSDGSVYAAQVDTVTTVALSEFPTELATLPKIDQPDWLCVGETGYIEQKRFVDPSEMVTGYFIDEHGRHVFLNKDLLAFQRHTYSNSLCADYLNCRDLSFTQYYNDVLARGTDGSVRDPWRWELNTNLPMTTLSPSFRFRDDDWLMYDEAERNDLPVRFQSILDDRHVFGNSRGVLFQRWPETKVMVWAKW
jgi:hypothetical protein